MESFLQHRTNEVCKESIENVKSGQSQHQSCEDYFAQSQGVDRQREAKSRLHGDNYVGQIGDVVFESTNMVSTFGKPCAGIDLTGKAVGFYDSPASKESIESYQAMAADQEAYANKKSEQARELRGAVKTDSGYSRHYARRFSKIEWNSDSDSED